MLQKDIPVIIRIPVIPGFNDNVDTMHNMASFLSKYNNGVIERVDLLPYHKLGVGKYAALGYDYLLKRGKTPDDDVLVNFKNVFSNRGFKTMIEYL